LREPSRGIPSIGEPPYGHVELSVLSSSKVLFLGEGAFWEFSLRGHPNLVQTIVLQTSSYIVSLKVQKFYFEGAIKGDSSYR